MDGKDQDMIAHSAPQRARVDRQSVGGTGIVAGDGPQLARKAAGLGCITGFTVKLREDTLAHPVRGITMIKIGVTEPTVSLAG